MPKAKKARIVAPGKRPPTSSFGQAVRTDSAAASPPPRTPVQRRCAVRLQHRGSGHGVSVHPRRVGNGLDNVRRWRHEVAAPPRTTSDSVAEPALVKNVAERTPMAGSNSFEPGVNPLTSQRFNHQRKRTLLPTSDDQKDAPYTHSNKERSPTGPSNVQRADRPEHPLYALLVEHRVDFFLRFAQITTSGIQLQR